MFWGHFRPSKFRGINMRPSSSALLRSSSSAFLFLLLLHPLSRLKLTRLSSMAKVYPSATASSRPSFSALPASSSSEAATLTVWRKSLLFHGYGFTVFDSKGNLVFRVDNYGSGSRAEIVLMDADGKPLLTIRRKVRRDAIFLPKFRHEHFPVSSPICVAQ